MAKDSTLDLHCALFIRQKADAGLGDQLALLDEQNLSRAWRSLVSKLVLGALRWQPAWL